MSGWGALIRTEVPSRARLSVNDERIGQAIFFAAYLAAAWWATQLSSGSSVLVWFPPAAVAMAGFALLGARLLPLAFVAEMLSTAYVTGFGDRFGLGGNAVNAFVIVGAYFSAGWLIDRVQVDLRLRRLRDVLWLLIAVIVLGPVGATTGGVMVQLLLGMVEADEVSSQAALFWQGDAVAAAALMPVLVIVGSAALGRRHLALSDRAVPVVELAAEVLLPGVVAVVLFALGDPPLRFVYLVLVPIAFVAIRHGVVAASFANVWFAVVMVVGAYNTAPGMLDRSDMQLLMAVVALGGLVLGAVESQRRDAVRALHDLGLVVESSPDLIGTADVDGTVTYLNPAGRSLLGLDGLPTDSPLMARSFFAEVEGRSILDTAIATAVRDGVWAGDNVLQSSDGRAVPVSQVLITHFDADGRPDHVSTVCRDVTEEHRLVAQLGRQALYDDATGLANRALLREHLARVLADDTDDLVAVLLLDLRRFRVVNESLGYRAGDEVLGEVARRLRRGRRGRDLVARHGGDVFAVVIDDVRDEVDAITVAGGLLGVMAEPIPVAGKEIVLDAHLGIAVTARPDRSDAAGDADPLDVVRSAQIALSRAKEVGDRFALFDAGMDARARERLELETDLRSGIDSSQWWMAYQPVVSLDSRRVTSCEALLRWDHPARGALAPLSVVQLAEATGLIVPLGQKILERVAEQVVRWQHDGHTARVAVNVSGRQLQEPGFARAALRTIDGAGLEPRCVTVEITETVFASAVAEARLAVEDLRAGGCVVAMDDFGTGYSSLAGLRDLPIDVLKLDRSFITDLVGSKKSAAMVEAVVGVARALDLRLVAEGVEDVDQVDRLQELGCDQVQGYVFSRPMSADAFGALLAEDSPLAASG